MVGQHTLDVFILVRVQASEPNWSFYGRSHRKLKFASRMWPQPHQEAESKNTHVGVFTIFA